MSKLPPEDRLWFQAIYGINASLDIALDWWKQGFRPPWRLVRALEYAESAAREIRYRLYCHYGKGECPPARPLCDLLPDDAEDESDIKAIDPGESYDPADTL